jgi:hypothetical protein
VCDCPLTTYSLADRRAKTGKASPNSGTTLSGPSTGPVEYRPAAARTCSKRGLLTFVIERESIAMLSASTDLSTNLARANGGHPGA